MRSSTAIVILGALAAGGGTARASSIVALPAMDAPLGPSMIALHSQEVAPATAAVPPSIGDLPSQTATAKAAENGTDFVPVSPSIIASTAAPAIDEARTAAIGDGGKSLRRNPDLGPMVIRGGIVGDAFARSRSGPAPYGATQDEEPPQAQPEPPSESRPPKRQVPL